MSKKMSAELDPLENKVDNNDAADFLLSNSKYHDCYFEVVNPDDKKPECIGVASVDLIAHSPVLREMIERAENPSLSFRPKKVHVTDVSPATFRLMLRYVYGGKLPQITAIEAGALIHCAKRFQIPRLVQKALKRLTPTCAEDVFPALTHATNIEGSKLRKEVENIIQREIENIVKIPNFLELNEDCLHLIVKQERLNISEVELWNNIVRWAEHQVKMNAAKTLRDCLTKILRDVRLLTFTSEEILEHVLPTNVLTPEEFVALALAVRKGHPFESTALCNIQQRRLYRGEENESRKYLDDQGIKSRNGMCPHNPEIKQFNQLVVFNALSVGSGYFNVVRAEKSGDQCRSTLVTTARQSIELVSFTCKSNTVTFSKIWYNYTCEITIIGTKSGVVLSAEIIKIEDKAESDKGLVLPLKSKCGHSIILNDGETWIFRLEFNSPHPVHKLYSGGGRYKTVVDETCSQFSDACIKVTHEGSFHVLKIAYKV